MNKSILLATALISIAVLTDCGCRNEKESPFDNPLSVYNEEISNYFDASLGKKTIVPVGNQSVYVDFSDGIKQAVTNDSIKDVIKLISGKIKDDQVDWFGLGEKKYNGVGPIEFDKNRDFFNLMTNPSNYDDIYAPIEDALIQITNKSNDALLITDFEEYTPDKKEQPSPYAQAYFIKWIKAGNSITFYYSAYTEKNGNSKFPGRKKLYYVLFNYGKVNENSLITKFEKAIKGMIQKDLNKFEINPDPYSILNKYGGKEKTGLTLDLDVENKSALEIGDKEGALLFYQNGFLDNNRPFEAFEFGQSLNDLYQFYFKEKRRFSKKLYLDATNNTSYLLRNAKVQVTDVTADYEKYIKSKEAEKNVPVLENDEGNNKVWTKADADNPIIEECYKKNTAKLNNEYIYNYTKGEMITEVFDFDSSIFSDRLKNSPKEVELVTTFHKNFTGKYNNLEPVILRIDYVVEATEENYNAQLNDFKWNSIIDKANGVNESLYQSIRNTLQDVKPKGIIYSFYLKIEPSK